MALNDATLGALIKSEIIAELGAAANDALLAKVCNAIARAVNSHIKSNAVVTSTVPATGLTSAAPGAPVTGSATGTGTVA